ncbi:hypothetical protein RUND412_005891 [Rhizina undulata]
MDLCATSTVGIAACGFALATPQSDTQPATDHLTTRPLSTNTNIHNHNNNLLRDPCAALLAGLPRHDSQESYLPPAVPVPASAVRRPFTSRSWFRRLSESISSSSVSSSPPSSTHSSIKSSSRSRPASSSPSSRPPTRNKLVKRSRSQRLSTSNCHFAPSPQRPSTAVHQSSPGGQSSNLTPIHASCPSTSHQEPTYFQPYDPKPVDSWRVFFIAKRQRIKQTPSSTGTKLTKLGKVRRIYPDFIRRRQGPTLVLAPVVSADPSDNDADSVCTGRDSLYFESRPTTSQMGETQHQTGRHRHSTSTSPASPRRLVRRSFSISNFLVGSAPRRSSSQSHHDEDDDESVSSGLIGLCPMNMTFGRRYSTPTDSHSSYQRSSGPATPLPVEEEQEQPPPIQSLSVLELNLESVPANNYSAHVDDHLESFTAANHNVPQPNMQYPSTVPRTHRLSLMSSCERASTLIGSEDLNHFETDFDFQSETVFDSMRTRVSEQPPIRADSIFDMTVPPLDMIPTPQPMEPKFGQKQYGDDDDYTTRAVEKLGGSSPNTSRLTAQFQSTKISFDDDDDDGWSSDWDVPSRSIDGEPHNRLSLPGGLRPYGALSLGMNTSNNSRTTFDTAREGLSNDESSIREASSILDWNEGIATVVTSPTTPGYRPKTVHAKESVLTTSRPGRRVSSYHVRSQSAPLTNSVHGRAPLPSENWDDDFLDDDGDDGMGLGNNVIVIPRAIEERQASVMGHLGNIREFALLVEDLKRLRLMGTAMGMRDGPYKLLWDEADAVIALATLRDEKELGHSKEKLRTRDTNRPPSIDDRENRKSCPLPTRRSSVLLPDDDIFGGNATAATNGAPIIHQLKHAHRSCPLPSTSAPQGKKKPLRGSAVDAIKNMMERLKKQASRGSLASTSSTGSTPGKFEFDTGMLSDLVVRVTDLRKELTALVEHESPNNAIDRISLGSKVGVVERDKESNFDLELSPVKSTFEDAYGTGIERVRSGGMDFRSVVGVA